jgi:hypothetical protein
MSFEKRVLNLIEPAMTEGHAEFENGTLFIEDVSGDIGRKVFHILSKEFGVGKVNVNIYNPVNGFVFDFVA